MPEQLTKHPEVTLQVLKSAGARCGEGATQGILKACPSERFCALPGGEICVYGLPEAARMTQVRPAELVAAAGMSAPGGGATSALEMAPPSGPAPFDPTSAALGVLIGVVLAAATRRLRRSY